jgi:predicted lipoprotein with Yx(FWY)xxD motif
MIGRPPSPRVKLVLVAAMLTAGLAAGPLLSGPGASAQTGASADCAAGLTGAPSGPATVSAASTPYGRVLVVGAGDTSGCSLYMLSADALHGLTSAPFACSDNPNPTTLPCDTALWPALLTEGAPIAGRGVNPTLLGTVTRADMTFGGVVQQVTYAGLPLYRFLFDETPGEREGANLFDPVTSPTGTWYLVDPARGLPATGEAQLQLETAPVGGNGPEESVLAASMNDTFSVFPHASLPAYTLSTDQGATSACQGQCALIWEPVLTSGTAAAGENVDQRALGIVVRRDGSHQVTYNGRPLYLYTGDAYIPGIVGSAGSINGAGMTTPWGVFNTIPLTA